MKAYIESIFARKHYLAEKINGDHSKLLATILADDGFLTCDDLEVVEAICAEERSEILLDILLGKKDDNWCDIFLDLLEAIGLNHLAKLIKGIGCPEVKIKSATASGTSAYLNRNFCNEFSPIKATNVQCVSHETSPKQIDVVTNDGKTGDAAGTSASYNVDSISTSNHFSESDANLNLRNYQLELAGPGISGNNCVIVAPTGTGKTHVAVYICKEHLKSERCKKVVFLVPKVPLVQQQYSTFKRYLGEDIGLAQVSGGNEASVPVAKLLEINQVLVMTHQLLLNTLTQKEFDLQDISLLIFDECHHTMKEHPYKQIMDRYFEIKHMNSKRLPQIVGLTASPGSGRASRQEQAMEYIMKLLGNLDVTFAPVQVLKHREELDQYDSRGKFDTISVSRPANDAFSNAINVVMDEIEEAVRRLLSLNENVVKDSVKFEVPLRHGSQDYEQAIVDFDKQSILLEDSDLSRKLHICAVHLRAYNDALLINDHVRPSDASYYIDKTLFDDSTVGNVSKQMLRELYESKGVASLATNAPSPLLARLIVLLRDHFTRKPDSRCIVFARTREIAQSLVVCISDDPSMSGLKLNPEFLTGSGARGYDGGLTKTEQLDRLKRFDEGGCKLITATTVAEEGIDIRACNLVVTYNHTTSEVAQVQRKGRGRAQDSKMYVLAYKDSSFIEKGDINTARDQLTQDCLKELRKMDPSELEKRIRKIQAEQRDLVLAVAASRNTKSDEVWQLLCKACKKPATTSDHVRTIKGTHRAIVDRDFPSAASVKRRMFAKQLPGNDEILVGSVFCGDPSCGQSWGSHMLYKKVPVSVLKIENFVLVNRNTGERTTRKQWSKAPFRVLPLSDEDECTLVDMLGSDAAGLDRFDSLSCGDDSVGFDYE